MHLLSLEGYTLSYAGLRAPVLFADAPLNGSAKPPDGHLGLTRRSDWNPERLTDTSLIMNLENAIERRQCAREWTIENEIVIEWEEPTGVCSSQGKLLNISDRGALVVSDSVVQSTGPVFLQMKTPVKTDRIVAQVVRRGGNHELGMQFIGASPWDFRLAATTGIDLNGLFGLSDSDRFSNSGESETRARIDSERSVEGPGHRGVRSPRDEVFGHAWVGSEGWRKTSIPAYRPPGISCITFFGPH
jgi:hypothetical protein